MSYLNAHASALQSGHGDHSSLNRPCRRSSGNVIGTLTKKTGVLIM